MFELALAFLTGLLIGSFLNVCIYRMPRDLSVVRPRSFCPECETPIRWYDNVPVLSYAVLRGRCRACSARIPLRYPIVELTTAIVFAMIVALHGLTPLAVKHCVFAALLIGLTFSDLEERILPDEFTYGGIVLGLALAFFVPFEFGLAPLFVPEWDPRMASVLEAALAAAFTSAALWSVGALYHKVRKREGLGLGDVKMVAMMGAFLALHGTLFAMIVGSVLGSVLGLVYIWVSGKDSATYELPFGAFLGIGGLTVILLRPFLP